MSAAAPQTGPEARAARSRSRWPWRRVAEITETSVTLVCGHRVPTHLLDKFREACQGRAIHELTANCRRCAKEAAWTT